MDLSKVSIKIKNYKCVGDEPMGFDEIKPINIIIGKNNSGKSTLLQMIDAAINGQNLDGLGHKKKAEPFFQISTELSQEELHTVFRKELIGNYSPTMSDWEYGKKYIGAKISWEYEAKNRNAKTAFKLAPPLMNLNKKMENEISSNLLRVVGNPFEGKIFKRIAAERDIQSEGEDTSKELQPNGAKFTNIIRLYLNEVALSSDLIEREFLSEINSIVEPDSKFERIVVQRHETGHWEIFLEEHGKGRISLSHTGSGLKTILLVVFLVKMVPKIKGKDLSNYVFGLEELENNLHPSMLRRLFFYLRQIAEREKATFFIATHSNVVIDLFSKDQLAQIVHVRHDGSVAKAEVIKTYVQTQGVLDDLDVRASDLLQSNVVVWVEGPSDRIYFNRWMEVLSNGEIKEGAQYQCVFYGGRVLAHFSAASEKIDDDELVSILRINRNAIILIDSDMTKERGVLNATKQRIIDEISNSGGMFWVTAGKEIENYIPTEAIKAGFGIDESVRSLKKSEDFWKYLDSIKRGYGGRFKEQKVLLAEKVRPLIDETGMRKTLDLFDKANECLIRIRRWNRLDQIGAAE